ncbi:MAG TPA: metallophosphoesterase, partial [Armatimonadota bacterium]|nr:metallophosphoesterase [Armatimonadota bacterium]
MASDPIRWLHVSDFHVGTDDYAQARRFRQIVEFIRERRDRDDWRPDLVFITGDVANAGKVDQYGIFERKFLRKLRVELPSECAKRIFAVPGNHDVDQRAAQAAQTHGALDNVPHLLDPTTEGRGLRQTVFPRFEAFVNSGPSSGGDRWLLSDTGADVKTIDVRGHKVSIVRINTAWLSNADDDRDQLTPGAEML